MQKATIEVIYKCCWNFSMWELKASTEIHFRAFN